MGSQKSFFGSTWAQTLRAASNTSYWLPHIPTCFSTEDSNRQTLGSGPCTAERGSIRPDPGQNECMHVVAYPKFQGPKLRAWNYQYGECMYFEYFCMLQKGSIHPDPGQYEGMHADTRFPAHHRGTLFDAPPPDPPEPLLAPPTRSLANIVSTFLSSSDFPDAPTCKHSKVSVPSPNKRGSYTTKSPKRSTTYRRGVTSAGTSGTSRTKLLEHGSLQPSRIPTTSSARASRSVLRTSS